MTASWECPACGVRVDGSDRLFDIRVAFHQGHAHVTAGATPCVCGEDVEHTCAGLYGQPLIRDLERRYLRRGSVTHLILPAYRFIDRSLCGLVGDWYGTGFQDEYDRAAALRTCRLCERLATP